MTIIVKSQGGGCHTWNSVFCCRPKDEGDFLLISFLFLNFTIPLLCLSQITNFHFSFAMLLTFIFLMPYDYLSLFFWQIANFHFLCHFASFHFFCHFANFHFSSFATIGVDSFSSTTSQLLWSWLLLGFSFSSPPHHIQRGRSVKFRQGSSFILQKCFLPP